LIDLCADAFAVEHERMPIIGQGHTHREPLGLQMGISAITAVPVSAAPTVANVLDFCAEIPARYRANAKLVMNADTLYAIIAQLATEVTAAQFLMDRLPPMLESEYVAEGKIIGGDWSRYVVYYIRLMQIITGIAAERKTQEIVVTETWTGHATQTDAFRIATGITYG
jgi:HK97 family phage major capsid protein